MSILYPECLVLPTQCKRVVLQLVSICDERIIPGVPGAGPVLQHSVSSRQSTRPRYSKMRWSIAGCVQSARRLHDERTIS